MSFDPEKHHRRSIRLKGYDYTQAGAYFVTACTQNRECFFGKIVDGVLRLSVAGQMIQRVWQELPEYYPGVDVDSFIVMPNHIHGIVVLSNVGAGPRACPTNEGQPQGVAPTGVAPTGVAPTGVAPTGVAPTGVAPTGVTPTGVTPTGIAPTGVAPTGVAPTGVTPTGIAPTGVAPLKASTISLPDVVHRFKSLTTALYRYGVAQKGWTPFDRRLWQRNYYEHVVRDEDELNPIRQYIEDNPLKWEMDRENPAAHGTKSREQWQV